ncbi:MAG: potassium-transporting ATPase subunit KdpC [Acidobacteria bacterium]|nr:potassium-transporting ATPase subunit KdpC [Acidobacteriota bacterium]
MWNQLLPGFRMTLALTVLTGMIYPGVVTALCQTLFSAQANGSLIVRNGRVVGSALIGQSFARPEYFHPRPSAAGIDGYDAASSGGSNLGPTSQKLMDRVKATVAKLQAQNPSHQGEWPADLATASASGLDPHISPAAARMQVERVARSRSVSIEQVKEMLVRFTESRDLGFLGEPRVNVLLLNLELDRVLPTK